MGTPLIKPPGGTRRNETPGESRAFYFRIAARSNVELKCNPSIICEMLSPEEVIVNYIDHLSERPFVDQALREHSVTTLVQETIHLIREHDPERSYCALLFIRDVSTGHLGDEVASHFRSAILNSSLFDEMKSCLSVPNFTIRYQTVYTFGKLFFKENILTLVKTFESRRDIDPLLIDGLLLEIRWLEQDDYNHWRRVEILADSLVDFSRWCAVQVISREDGLTEYPKFQPLLSKLVNDKFPPIKFEMLYRIEEASKIAYARKLTKKERKSRRSELKEENARIAKLRPPLTFSDLELRFWNSHTSPDYTIRDLQAFLENFG